MSLATTDKREIKEVPRHPNWPTEKNLTLEWVLAQRKHTIEEIQSAIAPYVPRSVDQIIHTLGPSLRADSPLEMVRVEYAWMGEQLEYMCDIPIRHLYGDKRSWEIVSSMLIDELERRGFEKRILWDDDECVFSVYVEEQPEYAEKE